MLRLNFIGPTGSGKTTAARFVLGQCDGARIGWGDALKVEFYDRLADGTLVHVRPTPVPCEKMHVPALDDDDAKIAWIDEHKDALRAGLQWYATEYRRAQDADYWFKRGMERLQLLLALPNIALIVFDDTRFVNEFEGLARIGFVSVRLCVPPATQERRLVARDGTFDRSVRSHRSERELADAPTDFTIDNEGDLVALYAQLERLLVAVRHRAA